MKTQFFRFILYSIIASLAWLNLEAVSPSAPGEHGVHFCGYTGQQPDNRRYARSLADLDVGEPRTVRLIYFLPNDRPYRAEVVQKMKDMIRSVQTFYAEQMQSHGYEKMTFRFETDPQGEPIIHHVDGEYPDSYYLINDVYWQEIEQKFDIWRNNVYCLVWDNSTDLVFPGAGGTGVNTGKINGRVTIVGGFSWTAMAHELGHAFGLPHDFRDGSYIMSYGQAPNRLSACNAKFLSVHPYFNLNTPIEEGEPPAIGLISPLTYPAGSQSIPVRLKVNDSTGLHQVLLHGSDGLVACLGLRGEKEADVNFDYDGAFTPNGFVSLSSLAAHPISVEVVDTEGNVSSRAPFKLAESSPYHITTIEAHTDGVNFIAFLPDGGSLASGSWDDTVKLWDVATQQNIAIPRLRSSSVAFSSDGKKIASGSYDGTVMLWDAATQQNIGTLEGHTDRILSVAFSSDGKKIASGSYDGTIMLWDVTAQQNIGALEGHTDGILSVAFSSDGKKIASGSLDGTTRLWDVATQQNIGTLKADGRAPPTHSVAFSPDGAILAIGRGNDAFGGTVRLWEVSTGRILASFVPHLHSVTCVSFSRDGGMFASGSLDGTVKLWDMATQAGIVTLPHLYEVWSVSFSPDGRTLASGTLGGTVELWDTSGLIGARLEALAVADIRDRNLRAAIATALGKPPSALIVRGNLPTLIRLEASNANISNLTGLAGATNLKSLNLWDNNISDISPLAGLANLTELILSDNSISDISSLTGLANLTSLGLGGNDISDISMVTRFSDLTKLWLYDSNISDISSLTGLTNLTLLDLKGNDVSDISAVSGLANLKTLYLASNSISDISPLADLTHLTWLNLDNNSISDISSLTGLSKLERLRLGLNDISDISAVSGMTNLTSLYLASSSISDISPLADLTQLTWLVLYNNNISDISPLVENTGLGSGDMVYVNSNSLSYRSIYTHIPALQGRGVEVFFDNRTPVRIRMVSGNDQEAGPGVVLKNAFVVEVQDENGDAFEGVPVTFTVASGGGTLSGTSVTTDANGRAESTLTLGPEPGTNTVVATVTGVQGQQTFTAEGIQTPKAFWIISGLDQTGLVGKVLPNPIAVEVRDKSGEPLPGVQVTFTVSSGGRTLSVTSATTDDNGRAESALTLGPEPGTNTVTVSVAGIQEEQTVTAIAEFPPIPEDVNGDDVVNILDLVLVAAVLGEKGADLAADVNGDEVVDILDLVLVAGAFENAAAAPSARYRDLERDFHGNSIAFAIHSLDPSLSTRLITPTRANVGQWLAQAGELDLMDPASREGVLYLEQLLAALTPKETMLLPNYPNPFNPETWIPYQLAEGADVTLIIYDTNGIIVRRLELGHQLAGYYAERGRAAYWDGRNEYGEQMASGVYFYHLSAGNYSAARKMLIQK